MIVMEKNSELCKTYAFESIPPIDPFLFPIGEISGTVEYSPMSIAFSEGTFPAPPVSVPKVCVKLVNTLHPDNYFPNRIKRYWTLESENITDFKADLSFTYAQADVEGDEAELRVIQKNTTGWYSGNPTDTGTNTLSMTGVTTTLTTFTGGGNESTITIDSLTASGVEVGIRVDWHTAFESGISGFNLYRADSADPTEKPIDPINASIIPSDPGAYVYTDTHPTPLVDQYYWLEVVPISSDPEDFGPVSAIWYFYTIHLPIIRNP